VPGHRIARGGRVASGWSLRWYRTRAWKRADAIALEDRNQIPCATGGDVGEGVQVFRRPRDARLPEIDRSIVGAAA